MSGGVGSIFDSERLTREMEREMDRGLAREPVAGPATGSILLHLALFVLIGYYAWILGFFHHHLWGNSGTGQSMQVSLVSNALPLPAEQINKNVLATETPSQAPAPPAPKEEHHVDETAIPIAGRREKPKKRTEHKTEQHQPKQPLDRAAYGEQAGSAMPRSTVQPSTAAQTTTVSNGDFGSLFPWYVRVITQKVSQNWLRGMVDPSTPKGAMTEIYFRIDREGDPEFSTIRVAVSSGSPTLDLSCKQAVQRVDTFGPLPAASRDSYLDVTYDCTY